MELMGILGSIVIADSQVFSHGIMWPTYSLVRNIMNTIVQNYMQTVQVDRRVIIPEFFTFIGGLVCLHCKHTK